MIASGFSETSLRGIARFAQEHGWHVSGDIIRIGALPEGWQGDGLLACLPQSPELLSQLIAADAPCVTFAESSDAAGLPLVAPDEAEIGRLAADHLLERSHRHFACAPFVDGLADGGRLAAFQARLAEQGCTCRVLPPVYTRCGSCWREDHATRRRLLIGELSRLPRPAAVFAFNDSVAVDVIDACREAGLSVPEDVAVLGVGNSIFCTASSVPLSSVDIDLEEIGYRAAARLEEMMSGAAPTSAALHVRPKGIVTRVSTDVIAVSDPRVARALSYIAEHYPEPGLGIDAIARSVGMSRRNLERSFRHETGRTLHEHIIDVRMREAARLLAVSPKTRTADVAGLVGLTEERTFFRVFRRHFGMSPKAHRDWTARTRFATEHSGARLNPILPESLAPHPLTPGTRFTAA